MRDGELLALLVDLIDDAVERGLGCRVCDFNLFLFLYEATARLPRKDCARLVALSNARKTRAKVEAQVLSTMEYILEDGGEGPGLRLVQGRRTCGDGVAPRAG